MNGDIVVCYGRQFGETKVTAGAAYSTQGNSDPKILNVCASLPIGIGLTFAVAGGVESNADDDDNGDKPRPILPARQGQLHPSRSLPDWQ